MIARMIEDEALVPDAPEEEQAVPRRPREDWRSWLPAGTAMPPMITRAEVLGKLIERGLRVSERELRYWETTGALPAPVRQFHEGATQALYPWWHHRIVAKVPTLRGQGLRWSDVGQRLREDFRAEASAPIKGEWLSQDARPALPADLVEALQRFMAHMKREHDVDVQVASLDIVGPNRQIINYTLFPPRNTSDWSDW